ncbi:MAG: hypothetical protein ACFE0Q_12955 [Anaerolineae bacterium]
MTSERYQALCDYLQRYYDVRPYQRHGVMHPVVHHSPSPEQVSDIDSVLGHLNPQAINTGELAFYDYGYLHTLENSGRHLFNGVTYAFQRLRTHPLRVDARPGHYFDMIATCIALEHELMDAFDGKLVRLPLRTQYHRTHNPQTALQSGKGRSGAIGGVMLTVFNRGDQYQAIVSRRTANHATRPHALHLLPAFIFQPQDIEHVQQEWTFKYHLYREYLEELVGMAEGTAHMTAHPALRDLQAMEADGRALMHLTGVSMNLLTLRLEISAVLVIHDADWWQAMQSGKRGYQLNTPETDSALLYVPVSEDDDALLRQLPHDYYLNMVPQAIPAFWEGITHARLLIADYRA